MPGGDCLRRVALPYEGLLEYWQPVNGGLQQGWDVEVRPESSDDLLVLELTLDPAMDWQVDPDQRGAQLLGTTGGRWRYDGLEAWDSLGESLEAWMVDTQTGLSIFVDDTGATYPITVDPTLSQDTSLFASDGDTEDNFGISVSGAGDVNGDGYDDVIVGAWFDDDVAVSTGSAYVFSGSATGIDLATETRLTASDAAQADYFGWSVSGAGDVDGDGYDDVIVGAYRGGSVGAAYVYRGGAGGVERSTEVILTVEFGTADDFGWSVSDAGDVNNDGYGDVVVGAPGNAVQPGAAYVYMGGPDGIQVISELKFSASDGVPLDEFGFSVSAAGDVNGDGFGDVVVGARAADENGVGSGAAYVYLGSVNGTNPADEVKLMASDGAANDWYGDSVSGAGDVDGDGYADVLVGAYLDDDAGGASGAAYLYTGGVDGVASSTEVKITASDAAGDDHFGIAVSGAGDVDGDGFGDVIIGAQWDGDGGSKTGSAWLYQGSSAGLNLSLGLKLNAADGEPDDYFGTSVSGAGDVNGDGADDVLVGVYRDGENGVYSGSVAVFLGSCTAASTWYADVDGDGYGGPASSHSGCQPPGYVADDTDCDDGDDDRYPGNVEVAGDSVDQDCDGDDFLNDDVQVPGPGDLTGGSSSKTPEPWPALFCSATGGTPVPGLCTLGLWLLVGLRRRR
ncbi:MAG: hypothetical protein GWP91_21950, partial [Rhodobacterales bacterium]|nr:hypothetical protein [Rhodobacterales bacterium]